jgi:hypothetical protein
LLDVSTKLDKIVIDIDNLSIAFPRKHQEQGGIIVYAFEEKTQQGHMNIVDFDGTSLVAALKKEVTRRFGEDTWVDLTEGLGNLVSISPKKCGSKMTGELIRRLERTADRETVRDILLNIHDGQQKSDFDWAVRKFARCDKKIDRFIEDCQEENKYRLFELYNSGEPYFDQTITYEVLTFILEHPEMLFAVRRGSKIYHTMFPKNMEEYIRESDSERRRYHACRCPYARDSVLSNGPAVPKVFCNYCLGRVKLMWETILEMSLDGRVFESALEGDDLCRYIIHLPDDIVEKYR